MFVIQSYRWLRRRTVIRCLGDTCLSRSRKHQNVRRCSRTDPRSWVRSTTMAFVHDTIKLGGMT